MEEGREIVIKRHILASTGRIQDVFLDDIEKYKMYNVIISHDKLQYYGVRQYFRIFTHGKPDPKYWKVQNTISLRILSYNKFKEDLKRDGIVKSFILECPI